MSTEDEHLELPPAPAYGLACEGIKDGAGAQAERIITVMAFALHHAKQLRYVHLPFDRLFFSFLVVLHWPT